MRVLPIEVIAVGAAIALAVGVSLSFANACTSLLFHINIECHTSKAISEQQASDDISHGLMLPCLMRKGSLRWGTRNATAPRP